MIPYYRRKRSVGEFAGTEFEPPPSNAKDGSNQITENLTRNPHVQVIFTADTTSVVSNALHESEDLHPVVKYGIPIGAMFLLGLFIYATFSKRWNRKVAMATISAESMKLNTTTCLDTTTEYVSCQIASAENSVLRHIEEHFEKTGKAIINDLPIANEEELMSGLNKTIDQLEMKLKGNLSQQFERTKGSIMSEARDEFTAARDTMDLLKNHGISEDRRNKSESAESTQSEHMENKLSEIQNKISIIIREKISDGPNSLLLTTQQEILHTNDLLNNIIPTTLRESEDWNRTRSRVKQMEELLIKDVKAIIIGKEENILQYIQNQINEIKHISEAEIEIGTYQNDMEVDIKQPGKMSINESYDIVQKIEAKKSSVDVNNETSMEKTDTGEEGSINEKIIADGITHNQIEQEQKLCSRCAAAKNYSEESTRTATTEINDKNDKMEEIKLKTENNNTIITNTSNEENKDNPTRERENAVFGINENEILEVPERDERRNNYSVREQAENSIKLWLERFKQAVPHLPNNQDSFKKYDKPENSKGYKISDNNVERKGNNHVVIDIDGLSKKSESLSGNHFEENTTNKQVSSNGPNETTEVEIHEHRIEKEAKVPEERASSSTMLLDIDNSFLNAGGKQEEDDGKSDVKITVEAQHKEEEDAEEFERFKSQIETKNKTIQIKISEHATDELEVKEKKSNFSEKQFNTDDNLLEFDDHTYVEGKYSEDLDVHSSTESEKTKKNYECIEPEIEEKKNEIEIHKNELKVSEEFSKPLLDNGCSSNGLDSMEKSEARTDESDKKLSTTNQQAEENAAKYKQFKSGIETKENEIGANDVTDVMRETNLITKNEDENQKQPEPHAESLIKWSKIDDFPEDDNNTWPSHLPKIIVKPMTKESDLEITMESLVAGGGEEAKIDTISDHLYDKEWPVNEKAKVKPDALHEEIIKICQGRTFENNQYEESISRSEKRDKEESEEISENKDLCSDQYIIKDKNFKEEPDKNVPMASGDYLQKEKSDEAANAHISIGDHIKEKSTAIQEAKIIKEEEADDIHDKENKAFDTKELLDKYKEIREDMDNWKFNKNGDRKESVDSTSSDISSSSKESSSNYEIRKEEERDTYPVLKLPNMDDKLRKKRKINRRQLKSLDSGVHHYYGEYIAIEFPINELDETVDKIAPIKDTPVFISTNSRGYKNEENSSGNPIQSEEIYTSERGNIDNQL